MLRPSLSVRAFLPADLPAVRPWFNDPNVQRWLGGPDWPEAILRVGAAFRPGDDFRGRIVLAQRTILLLEDERTPVALAGGELYDRETCFAGEGPEGARFIDAPGPHRPEAGLVAVVDPHRQRQGWGSLAIRQCMALPEFAAAVAFIAGIEPDNLASRRLFEYLGFSQESDMPDWEDMLTYRKIVINPG